MSADKKLAPASSYSSMSAKTDEGVDTRYSEILSIRNKKLLTCLLNPTDIAQLQEAKRRHGLPPFDAVLLGGSVFFLGAASQAKKS